MKQLIYKIREIAQRIASTENRRSELARFLRNMPEAKLFSRMNPDPLDNMKIVGIDGGLAKKSLQGFDCMLVRSVGVCFHYEKGKVNGVEYFPSRIPTPKAEIAEALSDMDWAYSTSITRQESEVKTARQCMERFKPDVLLMHGPIIPHYSDRPSRSSSVYEHYQGLINECKELYKDAQQSDVILAGVVEDSRSIVFCKYIKDILPGYKAKPELAELLDKTRDTNLLFLVLNRGEKSRLFKYSERPEEHPVLKDLEGYGDMVYSFYLKTARWDRPVRVDFLKGGVDEGRLASILLAISGQHSGYGLPAPLIEADNAARLSDSEIENFYSQILSLTGNIPGMMGMRREQRPF